MKTLQEAAAIMGYSQTPLSTVGLASLLKLSYPISVREVITLGSYPMDSAIREKWAESGCEKGVLGYPTTETLSLCDGNGPIRYNDFEHGSIYWTAKYGAHIVLDPVRAKLKQLPIGFKLAPIDDTTKAADGQGLFNNFNDDYWETPNSEVSPPTEIAYWVAIYWSPYGAYYLSSVILNKWKTELNGENGPMGYPITDMTSYELLFKVPNDPHGGVDTDMAYYVRFQHGAISWCTDWSTCDWSQISANCQRKIYVRYGDNVDPLPPEYYLGPFGTQPVPVPPDQSSWSLRLLIGSPVESPVYCRSLAPRGR